MSTAIASAHYDARTQTLMVFFVKGGSYTYHGVPPEVGEPFERDPRGGYFNAMIRNSYD